MSPNPSSILSLLFKKLSEANIHRGKFEFGNYIVGDCKGIRRSREKNVM